MEKGVKRAYSVEEPYSGKTIYLIFGFPIEVYIIFGLYGGGLHSKNIKVNDGLIIDRAMKKKEVIALFQEHFDPYTKWNYENLLLLTLNKL